MHHGQHEPLARGGVRGAGRPGEDVVLEDLGPGQLRQRQLPQQRRHRLALPRGLHDLHAGGQVHAHGPHRLPDLRARIGQQRPAGGLRGRWEGAPRLRPARPLRQGLRRGRRASGCEVHQGDALRRPREGAEDRRGPHDAAAALPVQGRGAEAGAAVLLRHREPHRKRCVLVLGQRRAAREHGAHARDRRQLDGRGAVRVRALRLFLMLTITCCLFIVMFSCSVAFVMYIYVCVLCN